jgi:ATP-dependent exoDNAse (exonuclease V) beta subunit
VSAPSLATSKTPVDADIRTRALDPTQSFCVTAPAGSGKTELLSQRVLRLLAQAEQPEEILAITFTRKASAEMQERILAALRFAATETEPAAAHKRLTWQLARAALQRDAERGWQLLQNPARLRVLTIDGLCASLTRQLPVLSTFGGSVGISDDPEALYRDAVRALLDLLETDGPIADAIAALLLHLDNDGERLQRLLIGLLANRDQWLRHLGRGSALDADSAQSIRAALEYTLEAIITDALAVVTQRLRVFQGDLLPLLDFAAVRLRETDPQHALAQFAGCVELPGATPECAAPWCTVVNVLLTQSGGWRKKLDKRDGFPVGDSAATKAPYKAQKENMLALIEAMSSDDSLLDALQQLRHLPSPAYPDSQWQMLRQLMLLLPIAAAQLKVVFQQRGEVDYTEVAQAALQALGDADAPGELLLRLDARIRHILVDEFQDTSSSQFHLLERLLEGWQEHNAASADQQTLFIVGDGMQSIYGFRAANVGLFLEARRRGVNGVALNDCALTVNFRSTPTIVNWVNQTFAQAFPLQEIASRGAVKYENSHAFNADRDGSEVRVFGLKGGLQGDDARAREAALCVELVQQALRASDSGEVAILVRNRGHLRAIVPALSAAGIAWRAADIDPLAARTVVMDLLSLFKALSNFADRIAWLAVLRSPLVGLTNSDLHALAGDGVRSIWSVMNDTALTSRLSADGRAALQRAVSTIGAALALRERKSPRSWLEGVWFALGGAACLGNGDGSDDDWRNLYTLFDLIEDLPPGADVAQLETRIATLYAKPPATTGARLWLMTIHKSKGLEFDTVIIPGLDKMPRSDDKPLLQWGEYLDRDGEEGLVLAATAAFGGDDDAIYDWLDFERKQKQQLEDTRLFYVAATRAISRLYLLFCDNRNNMEKPFAPASRSLLSRIWDAVGETVTWQVSAPTQISLLDVDEDLASPDTLTRVPPTWRSPMAASGALPLVEGVNLPNLEMPVASAEIHAGILIHALLEQCAVSGVEHWQRRSPQQRHALVEYLAKQNAVPADARGAIVARSVTAIDGALADERGRWLFDAAHAEPVAEWDLSLESGRLVVDRSFVDAEGVRWIVDYKTSAPHAGEALADFYAREMAAYRPQLLGYRDAVSVFDTRPIRLALYFPCIPGWCEL